MDEKNVRFWDAVWGILRFIPIPGFMRKYSMGTGMRALL